MITEDEECFDDENSILKFENGDTQFSIKDTKPTTPGKNGYW